MKCTDAMIDAGIEVLMADPGLSTAILVQAIYDAMSRAAPPSSEDHHTPTLTEIGAFLKRCDPRLVREYVNDDLNLKIALQESLEPQTADLEQFREAVEWAEDAADCSSHPNHKSYRFALTELLALINNHKDTP